MKKVITIVVLVFGTVFLMNAQDKMTKKDKMMDEAFQTISLEQTPGEFTQKSPNFFDGAFYIKQSLKNYLFAS